MKKFLKSNLFVIFILVVLCIPASIPLLRQDFYHFSDEPHIANLYQMIRALQSGQFPPRLAPDMSYGFSYPLFNFYYPLPFYFGSLFFVFTQSLITSLKLVFLLSLPLSSIAMYLWLKKHTSNLFAVVGSLVYIYTPYRAVDLYVRGALGEALAFVFFPLILLGIYKCFDSSKKLGVLILALSVASLMLSHNLAPILFFPFAFGYALILSINKKSPQRLFTVAIGVMVGLAVSAYFWLPAFIEKDLLVSQTPFFYKDHFPFIKQLLLPSWGYGASNPGLGDDISFQIGIVNILIVIISAVSLRGKFKGAKARLFLLFVIYLAGTLFLMNIRSSFLWETFSLSGYIQFPWRLLMITTFLTSGLIATLNKDKNKKLIIVLGIASILLTVGYFKPSGYYSVEDNDFLKRFFADRLVSGRSDQPSQQYINYSEDYLLLPKWVNKRADRLPDTRFASNQLKIEEVEEISAVDYKAKVFSKEGGELSIYFYYFPGWSVFLDNKPVKVRIQPEYGYMLLSVPEGSHQVEVMWTETMFRKIVDIVSVLGLTTIVVLLFRLKVGKI